MTKLAVYTTIGHIMFSLPALSEEQCSRVCEMDYWRSSTNQTILLGELERVPNVNSRHQYGWTAISVAASFGNFYAVQLLIRRGADVNVADNWNNTALFAAVGSGDIDIVEALVAAGADIFHIGSDGLNSIEFALQQGKVEIADMLNSSVNSGASRISAQESKATAVDLENDSEGNFPLGFIIYDVTDLPTSLVQQATCDNIEQMLFESVEKIAFFSKIFSNGELLYRMTTTAYCLNNETFSSMNMCVESLNKHEISFSDEEIQTRMVSADEPSCTYFSSIPKTVGIIEGEVWSEGECRYPQPLRTKTNLLCALE